VLEGPARALSDPSSKRALAPYGLPIVAEVVCTNPTRAERAARRLRPPLVAKVASPDLPFGPGAPGIVRGVQNALQARAAYSAALRSATIAVPDLRVLGVRILEDVAGLAALAARIERRAEGSLRLAVRPHGLAGAAPGTVREIVLPAGADDLDALVGTLAIPPLATSARGEPAADRTALVDLLARACLFAHELRDRVREVTLDPIVVRARGDGALVVDARVTVG
jgi:hypothetical protein